MHLEGVKGRILNMEMDTTNTQVKVGCKSIMRQYIDRLIDLLFYFYSNRSCYELELRYLVCE